MKTSALYLFLVLEILIFVNNVNVNFFTQCQLTTSKWLMLDHIHCMLNKVTLKFNAEIVVVENSNFGVKFVKV